MAPRPTPEDFEGAVQLREREAFERGRMEAERAIREQLIQQRSEMQSLQTGVLASLRDVIPQVAKDTEVALVTIAMETARRLVAGLEITPTLIEASILEALAEAQKAGRITVLLHKDDLTLVEQAGSPLARQEVGGERIRFEASPNITRGGCIVQTEFGTLDARREVKFELLRKAIQA
jgi:flagellar biosynthesis/type III secretory pathway protein FliH